MATMMLAATAPSGPVFAQAQDGGGLSPYNHLARVARLRPVAGAGEQRVVLKMQDA